MAGPPEVVRDSIALTESEKALLDTLMSAAKAANLSTVLRCAGGWVRDKLLGRESHDIDIALDNMLGKDFAEKVNEYLASEGLETHGVGVIQVNPEQSKHLETATMQVHGKWIDLVNLRSETYADGSRIPEMSFGTPAEDAQRRDFTVNSLFYNLNSAAVEDFTGQGLEDLRSGIIRTPLPPRETFLDDPLRVMRAVRFASRYNFSLDASLVEAATSDEVQQALDAKVSRERVGAELDGCLLGPHPLLSLQILHRLRLLPAVLRLPDPLRADIGPQAAVAGLALCTAAEALSQELVATGAAALSAEQRRLAFLCAALLPVRAARVAVKKKETPVASHVIKDSLKWKVKDAEAVNVVHADLPVLAATHAAIAHSGGPEGVEASARVAFGLALRRLKDHAAVAVTLVPLLGMPEAAPLGVDRGGDHPASSPPAGGHVAVVQQLQEAMVAWQLQECATWKPLVDGKGIMELLKLSKGGKAVGTLSAAVMEWQLANPGGTEAECKEWLQQNHAPAT